MTPKKQFLNAIKKNNLENVKSLMTTYNFNLDDLTYKDGETALHIAAKKGHNKIVEYLIAQGIEINIEDDYGDTALHCAAREGHFEIVGTLLINQGEHHIQNEFSETAEDLARKRLNLSIPKNTKKDLLTWCLFHMKPRSGTQNHQILDLFKNPWF